MSHVVPPDRGAWLRIAFRVDASLDIGTGHIMRCLALADALRDRGADCHFIGREHRGHLLELVRQRGYSAHSLGVASPIQAGAPGHAGWLGADWQDDARATGALLRAISPDWLVVDHYALDVRWERAHRTGPRALVIDDLANRDHDCDMLLDQNLGHGERLYAGRVPPACRLLTGPVFALLRPEFARRRADSLARRAAGGVRRLLITLGGVDKHNATGRVLEALARSALPETSSITVVMGAHAPWLEQVRGLAAGLRWPTDVRVGVSDMAALMAEADLAIGAAGSTSWERCCVGLPTLTVVVAPHEREVAEALQSAGAAYNVGDPSSAGFGAALGRAIDRLVASPELVVRASCAAAAIADGGGARRVVEALADPLHR